MRTSKTSKVSRRRGAGNFSWGVLAVEFWIEGDFSPRDSAGEPQSASERALARFCDHPAANALESRLWPSERFWG